MQTHSIPSNNIAAPSATPREAHQGAGISYMVEASNLDPVTRQNYKDHPLQGFTKTNLRSLVLRQTENYLKRGLWVEIYNDTTGELIAGPFDPDQPRPKYII